MNHDDTDKSHTMAWVMCVLALPVLYLLSVPPVVYAAARLTKDDYPPPWAMAYASPYTWLMEESPVKDPFQRYVQFWRALVFP